MFQFLIVLILIASILLIFVVLIQNSKGGGLASNFSAGNQFGGVAEQKSKLESTTWILVCIIAFCSIVASVSRSKTIGQENQSAVKEKMVTTPNVPVIPTIPNQEQ